MTEEANLRLFFSEIAELNKSAIEECVRKCMSGGVNVFSMVREHRHVAGVSFGKQQQLISAFFCLRHQTIMGSKTVYEELKKCGIRPGVALCVSIYVQKMPTEKVSGPDKTW